MAGSTLTRTKPCRQILAVGRIGDERPREPLRSKAAEGDRSVGTRQIPIDPRDLRRCAGRRLRFDEPNGLSCPGRVHTSGLVASGHETGPR